MTTQNAATPPAFNGLGGLLEMNRGLFFPGLAYQRYAQAARIIWDAELNLAREMMRANAALFDLRGDQPAATDDERPSVACVKPDNMPA